MIGVKGKHMSMKENQVLPFTVIGFAFSLFVAKQPDSICVIHTHILIVLFISCLQPSSILDIEHNTISPLTLLITALLIKGEYTTGIGGVTSLVR